MTSSISSTGTISSAGIGSGLDVETIVTKLMAIEQQPLKLLQNTATTIQTKISAFGGLQSSVSAFRDAALALTNPSTWSGTAGTSSDAGSVGVSSTASAVAGSYAVTVQALATTQSVASTAFAASSSTVGSGTLHINLGQWSAAPASTFTAASGATGLDIVVTDTDTLATLRDKINAAGAGVSASILTDTSGARLVLNSSATGAANGFQITAANGASGNLAALAYDPPNSTGTTLTQSAANAAAKINGLSVSSATNSLSDMIQGVTLNLFKVSSTPVQISVAQDTTATKTAIQGFVTAYNALATLLTTDTKYDSGTSTAGVLQGDSTAVTLQRQLRNLLGASSGASTVFTTLSQAGLETQADGTLKINDAKLTSAMGKLPELKKLFANSDTTNPANDGIVRRLRVLSDSLVNSDGLLTTRTEGLNTSLKTNQKSQDAMTDRLAAVEARMRAQYTALDTKMATLNTLSTYMTQQIANWNKTNANSNS
jgi:flagellar hook-associated protein 2